MEQNQNTAKNYYTIDLMHILKTVWHFAWVVVLVSVLAGVLGFCVSAFTIDPQYSSSVLLYVNNSSSGTGNGSGNVSSSDLNTSERLVKTYTEILRTRTTLDQVSKKLEADEGLKYTYGQLLGMVKAGSSNNTEVMKITVTANDPEAAAKIANTIAAVLPDRIAETINGSNMKVVDSAIPNPNKVAPSISNYTVKYAAIGFVITVLFFVILAILDDTVHDEEYILQTYEYPILAKIPNLLGSESKHYGYKRGKYYYTKPDSEKTEEK